MATKIICRASDCIFWEDKFCTSEEITYDPEEGCLTYEVLDDIIELDDDDDLEDDDLLDDDDLDDDLWDDEDDDDDLLLDEDDDDNDTERWLTKP